MTNRNPRLNLVFLVSDSIGRKIELPL